MGRKWKTFFSTYDLLQSHGLESLEEAKYRGLTTRQELWWKSHACKKRLYETNKTLGSLRRIFVFSWNSVKEQAYRSVIRPSLEHNCFVFNPNVSLINLKWSNRGLICSSPIDSGTHLVTCYNTSTGAYLKTDVNMFDLWYIK